jgi:iron complex outermembrane receptor protein
MSDTSHVRSTLIMGASIVALSAFAAPALAQTAGQPAAPADQGANANVVVIAQHTATRLQKIPVAVSVFTGASRDRIGISTVQEVTNFAPGFVYDPTTVHAYIRGIGRQSINVTDDQRVATYEDEFYVYSPYGLDKSSLFLSQEQIERGPQNVGGRQAAAGSIDMISVRPTNHPYAEVRATIGNYNHYEIEGAASDEIAPGLDGRIAGYWNEQSQGYLKNVAGGPSEFGHIKEWYVEGQLDWKVNDHSDLWARAFSSGWDNFGDAGARNGFSPGHWDEVNLTDGNECADCALFVNPNYAYSGLVPGAAAGRNPADPPVIATQLKTPGIFDNPSNSNYQNFAAVGPRHLTLKGYDDVNYIYTYHFPTVDFKYIGGWQAYNYDLNYPFVDTDVLNFTLPGSAFTPAGTLAALSAFPGCPSAAIPFACGTGGKALPAAVHLPAGSLLQIFPNQNLHYTEDDNWWSQELSLQSTDSGPFQWIVGGFYYQQHYDNPITFTDPQESQLANPFYAPPSALTSPLFASPANPTGFVGFGAGIPAPANPRSLIDINDYSITVQTYSGYGQLSYKVTDDVKITGALRWTHDRKFGVEDTRNLFFTSALIDGFGPFFGAATPALDITPTLTCLSGVQGACNGAALAQGVKSKGAIGTDGFARRLLDGSSSAVTGGAGVEWTPSPDIFVYARYGRGYEPISFNAGFVSAAPLVHPEYLNSYEVGYKQTFGHTLSIDVAAFYYDYIGFQQPISVLNNGVLQGQFINVPKAESTGIEFEGVWNPIHDLLITATYSYDYTAIRTGCSGSFTAVGHLFVPASGSLCVVDTQDPDAVAPGARPFPGQNAGTRVQSVNGSPLVNAPRNKFAITGAYTFHFDPGTLTVSASYVWRDNQEGTIFPRFYNTAPSWSDVDLRAIWAGDHDKYEIIGFIKNIGNTIQYDTGSGGGGLFGGNTHVFNPAVSLNWRNVYNIAPPRTFGVEVRYKFF